MIMAATYPELYAAIGVHSGLPYRSASDAVSAFAIMRTGVVQGALSSLPSSVPAIVFHGDHDRTVHPANGDAIIAQFKSDAYLLKTVTPAKTPDGVQYIRTVFRNSAGRAILEQWLIRGGGHAWSGGSASGSFTAPRGPDASREMLRFFGLSGG